MSDLILRQEDIDSFTSVLNQLVKKAHVTISVLIHRDGHLLATAGERESVDTTALSALASANFSSMIAVANLVGEKEFTTQLHVGAEHSIYISLVDEYSFIVSVFGVSVPVDPIKVYTQEYREELLAALEKLYNNEPDGDLPSAEDFAEKEGIEESAEQAQPRRLTHTVRPPKESGEDAAHAEEEAPRRRLKEPDGDDIDLDALANAIQLRKKPDGKKSPEKKSRKKPAYVVDGKPMNVVSLKNKPRRTKTGK